MYDMILFIFWWMVEEVGFHYESKGKERRDRKKEEGKKTSVFVSTFSSPKFLFSPLP